MTTTIILVATFVFVAALAAIPVAIILKKLGFSERWAGLLFVILILAPFVPGYVAGFIPASTMNALSIPVLGGIYKVIEWMPALIFLWVFALRRAPKDASRA